MGELVTLALAYDEPWSVPVPVRYAEGVSYLHAQSAWMDGLEAERRRVLKALWTPREDGDLSPKHLYGLLHETLERAGQLEAEIEQATDPLERLNRLGRLEVTSRFTRHLTHVAAHTRAEAPPRPTATL